jgi:EF-hand domain
LDLGEFMAVSIHIQKIENDEHLRKAFAFFDRDDSGFIEIEELSDALANDLGPNHEEILNAIVRDVDTDKVITKILPFFLLFPSLNFSDSSSKTTFPIGNFMNQ